MDWSQLPRILTNSGVVERRLSISFSGGQTSAVMTKRLLESKPDDVKVVVTFANTGCEHEETLNFIKECDTRLGFSTVWIEAVVCHTSRKGIRHKIVNYKTASRKGEPFEEFIKKYGIPNNANPQCTSRLKTEAMESYIQRELGWNKHTYATCIGIRYDELDRVPRRSRPPKIFCPLVDFQMTKEDVLAEINTWDFKLNLPGDHYGNCVWCWKKTIRKLLTLAKDSPEIFDFPERMEKEYMFHKSKNFLGARLFYRNNLRVKDLKKQAEHTNFIPYGTSLPIFDEDLDVGAGCGESCEIYTDSE